MRINMQKPHRALTANSFEDGLRDRMIPTHANRDDTGRYHTGDKGFNVFMALFEMISALHRNIADISDAKPLQGRPAQHMFKWANALHSTHRARA